MHLKSSHRRHPISRAFTLIELLTVIAIIGILAAIIIPTVGAVRQTAQAAACTSNLRQIATAVLLYAQDNKDMLPSAKEVSGEWSGIFRGIRDPSPGATAVIFADNGRQLSNHIGRYIETGRSATLWLCPGNKAVQDATTQNGASPNNRMAYLVNARSSTNPASFFGTFAGTPEQRRPKRLGEINNGTAANSASTGLMADGTRWNAVSGLSKIWMITDMDSTNYNNANSGGTSFIPAVGTAGEVPMPHKGGRNYVFFDGHVEYRKAANLPANP